MTKAQTHVEKRRVENRRPERQQLVEHGRVAFQQRFQETQEVQVHRLGQLQEVEMRMDAISKTVILESKDGCDIFYSQSSSTACIGPLLDADLPLVNALLAFVIISMLGMRVRDPLVVSYNTRGKS